MSIALKTYIIDTVIDLTRNGTKIVFMNEHGIEGSRGPYPGDVNFDLKIFTVTKGQTESSRDYLKNNNWAFKKGVYSTTITDEEF